MKKSVVSLVSLMFLALVGCGDKTSSTTSSVTPLPSDSSDAEVSDASDTSDVVPQTTEEKIISTLAKGYRANETLTVSEKWGSDDPTTTVSIFDLGVNSDYYQYRQYATVENEDGSLTTSSLTYAGSFTHLTGDDGKEYVNTFELNLDNKIEYTQLLDDYEDTPYVWSEYGFENAFKYLDALDLKKESDTVYYVDFENANETFVHDLSCEVYGMEFGNITEFKISLNDEGDPVGYSGKYETVEETLYSTTVISNVSFEANITALGEDVIKGNKVLTGEGDADLTAAFNALKAQNYNYTYQKYTGHYPDDGEFDASSSAVVTATSNSIKMTTYYKDGSVNFNGGYYTPYTGKTQKVISIGENYYKDGDASSYTISDEILPSFDNISPLFFDKVSDGVYTLNSDKYYTGYDNAYSAYSILNSSIVTNLTITLGEDGSITFENVIPAGAHTTAEKVVEVYSNIGGVTEDPIDTTKVKSTLGTLTWSEVFEGNSNLTGIYTYMGSQDNFDAIPTTQDNHSAYSLYFDEDGEDLEIQYAASSKTEVQAMIYNYDMIMKNAGFSDPTIDSKYGDHTYTKEVSTGIITVSAQYYSYIGTPYFVLVLSFSSNA